MMPVRISDGLVTVEKPGRVLHSLIIVRKKIDIQGMSQGSTLIAGSSVGPGDVPKVDLSSLFADDAVS